MAIPSNDDSYSYAATASSTEYDSDDTDSQSSTLNGDYIDKDMQYAIPSVQPNYYSKSEKTVLWIGIIILWIIIEIDQMTLYNYQNYAASEFNRISSLGALSTAGAIVLATMKPPIAKISDVVGRAEAYIVVVAIHVVSYILCATAPVFQQYAGGYVLYCVGHTGIHILNHIIVGSITTSRWRGIAISSMHLPYLAVPWLSGLIVDIVLNTFGWRWGIGMSAILMPMASLGVIGPLLYFRRRHNKGQMLRRPTAIKSFVAAIDLIGIILLATGFGMLLLPMAVAGNTEGEWTKTWAPFTMIMGIIFLGVFGIYETNYAIHPVMPAKYFRSLPLMIVCAIGLFDSFSSQVTHTYMYAWSTVVHDLSPRDATLVTYIPGCFHVVVGVVTGSLMYRSKRCEWLLGIGTIIRLGGYTIMSQLRGADNSVTDLLITQAIQGLGSGTIGPVLIVSAQIAVTSSELPQATALIFFTILIGSATGSAVAGAIYKNLFKPMLYKYLGDGASQHLIDAVFDSITSELPPRGSSDRDAINNAYSDVLKYTTFTALVGSSVVFFLVWFLPPLELSDKHHLSEEGEKDQFGAEYIAVPGKIQLQKPNMISMKTVKRP